MGRVTQGIGIGSEERWRILLDQARDRHFPTCSEESQAVSWAKAIAGSRGCAEQFTVLHPKRRFAPYLLVTEPDQETTDAYTFVAACRRCRGDLACCDGMRR